MDTKHTSAEKRQKQSEKHRIRNKSAKSAIRSTARKILVASQASDKPAAAAALLDMISKIDSAARKGIVKKNSAARKKSRMQKLVNALGK